MLAQLRTFFVIALTMFALPAIAAEQKCNYEPTQPDAAFIEAEKASGLEWVSDDLKAEVLAVVTKTVAINLVWSDLVAEFTALSIDRVTIDQRPADTLLAELDHSICTVNWGIDAMATAADFFPEAMILSSGSNLRY